MASFEIRFEDLDIGISVKEAIVAFPEITGRALYTSAIAIVIPQMRNIIQENKSIFRGELFQRLSAKVTIRDDGPELTVGAIAVPYSAEVDEGTGPRVIDSVERKKIVEWVRKKLMKEGSTSEGISAKGKVVKRRKKLSDSEILKAIKIAGLVIDKIQAEGSKPHPFIAPAWVVSKDAFVNDAVARIKARLKLF